MNASTKKPAEGLTCYHCGLEADSRFSLKLAGVERDFCCIGCQAVALAIVDGGLADFYKYRDTMSSRPEQGLERFDAYDIVSVQAAFVTPVFNSSRVNPSFENSSEVPSDEDSSISPNALQQVRLLVGGISCAACAWLIENILATLPGVSKVRVNVATHVCSFQWDSSQIKLSQVFSELHRVGYRPQPGTEVLAQQHRSRERKNALLRMGVAGLGMMQVGMVGIALHAGSLQGIDAIWQHYLRWVSLIFAVPVIVFSAQPFFSSALRSLRVKRPNMDVPVSLALILAFTASVVSTVTNSGEVYFDSVSMFTFFLLVGRFLEEGARHTSAAETEKLSQLLPLSVERVQGDVRELLPLANVSKGDLLFISAGDVVPCDALLQSKRAFVNESLLTGEAELIEKYQGDKLYAGSVLSEPSVDITVTATGNQTRLAEVQSLLVDAQAQKPKQQVLADYIASYFVVFVLILFVVVWGAWLMIDAQRAFWVALSVLVVTCPCALSLATPAALAAGLNRLRRLGFLIVAPNALDVFSKLTHIVFDKTGTLTCGEPKLLEVRCITPVSQEQVIDTVAALEAYSAHPLARAFASHRTPYSASSVKIAEGRGIEGKIEGRTFRFGKADYASEIAKTDNAPDFPSEGNWQLLADESGVVAWFKFGDEIRLDAAQAIENLQAQGFKLSLLSGDRQANVDRFVNNDLKSTFFTQKLGDLLPEQKLRKVRELQAGGDVVLMVGDGINDLPVLAAADVSVAMGAASRLAQVSADSVLLNQQLLSLVSSIQFARRVRHIIRQNLRWAIGYNILMVPAAACGFVPPYLAAIGMSLSSLVVVLNSLRLER